MTSQEQRVNVSLKIIKTKSYGPVLGLTEDQSKLIDAIEAHQPDKPVLLPGARKIDIENAQGESTQILQSRQKGTLTAIHGLPEEKLLHQKDIIALRQARANSLGNQQK